MNKRYLFGSIEEVISEMEELIEVENSIVRIVTSWSIYIESLNLTLKQRMEEAAKTLHEYLNEEVNTIKNESEYDPSVLDWSEDDVTLVYAEGYTKETGDRNYALEDCAYYRIFEV